ncbi:hypothetical protein Tco_0388032, partial [Tanacetum coccineum]
ATRNYSNVIGCNWEKIPFGLQWVGLRTGEEGTSSADIFTKDICRERIEFLIDKLGMRSFTHETLKELADEAEE